MIELMLEAERAMGFGLLENAERLYAQVVAADPRNSIAVTGLARIALERDDQRGAYELARRALAIDPENPVAGHLAQRMAEQLQMRGEPLPPDVETSASRRAADPARPAAIPASGQQAPAGSGLLGRLLRRRR